MSDVERKKDGGGRSSMAISYPREHTLSLARAYDEFLHTMWRLSHYGRAQTLDGTVYVMDADGKIHPEKDS